jgi:hypothetical protein
MSAHDSLSEIISLALGAVVGFEFIVYRCPDVAGPGNQKEGSYFPKKDLATPMILPILLRSYGKNFMA